MKLCEKRRKSECVKRRKEGRNKKEKLNEKYEWKNEIGIKTNEIEEK